MKQGGLKKDPRIGDVLYPGDLPLNPLARKAIPTSSSAPGKDRSRGGASGRFSTPSYFEEEVPMSSSLGRLLACVLVFVTTLLPLTTIC